MLPGTGRHCEGSFPSSLGWPTAENGQVTTCEVAGVPCPFQARALQPLARPSLAPRSASPPAQRSTPSTVTPTASVLPHTVPGRSQPAGRGCAAPALRHLLPTGARAEPAGAAAPRRHGERLGVRTPRAPGDALTCSEAGSCLPRRRRAGAAAADASAPRTPRRLPGAPTSASAPAGKGRGHVTPAATYRRRGRAEAVAGGGGCGRWRRRPAAGSRPRTLCPAPLSGEAGQKTRVGPPNFPGAAVGTGPLLPLLAQGCGRGRSPPFPTAVPRGGTGSCSSAAVQPAEGDGVCRSQAHTIHRREVGSVTRPGVLQSRR